LERGCGRTASSCPVCGLGRAHHDAEGGFYRCNQCAEDFTVRTGTVMERSHIPLHKWLYAMYLLVTARKGISSLQLAKEIGVTQKSAWFLLHRLREACGKDLRSCKASSKLTKPTSAGRSGTSTKDKRLNLGRGPSARRR
jgi:transposase-like protein